MSVIKAAHFGLMGNSTVEYSGKRFFHPLNVITNINSLYEYDGLLTVSRNSPKLSQYS